MDCDSVDRAEAVESLLSTDPFVKIGDLYLARVEVKSVEFFE